MKSTQTMQTVDILHNLCHFKNVLFAYKFNQLKAVAKTLELPLCLRSNKITCIFLLGIR